MTKLTDKIIEGGLNTAIKLVLPLEKWVFEKNKEDCFYYSKLGFEEEALGFAKDALVVGNCLLRDKNKLNPDYLCYLMNSMNTLDEFSNQLKRKIDNTQAYYMFKR